MPGSGYGRVVGRPFMRRGVKEKARRRSFSIIGGVIKYIIAGRVDFAERDEIKE
jgi:hypothetical protein